MTCYAFHFFHWHVDVATTTIVATTTATAAAAKNIETAQTNDQYFFAKLTFLHD